MHSFSMYYVEMHGQQNIKKNIYTVYVFDIVIEDTFICAIALYYLLVYVVCNKDLWGSDDGVSYVIPWSAWTWSM